MDVTRPRATKASQITWDLAATLIASLENGGVNELSVAGLSGALGDTQIPSAHKTAHQNGGGDEINVAGLSGVLGGNAVSNSGNYTGNDADNRSIAHGLGRTPKLVVIVTDQPNERFALNTRGVLWAVHDDDITNLHDCTAWTTTNFYTEATNDLTGINKIGNEYYWTAIG